MEREIKQVAMVMEALKIAYDLSWIQLEAKIVHCRDH